MKRNKKWVETSQQQENDEEDDEDNKHDWCHNWCKEGDCDSEDVISGCK